MHVPILSILFCLEARQCYWYCMCFIMNLPIMAKRDCIIIMMYELLWYYVALVVKHCVYRWEI